MKQIFMPTVAALLLIVFAVPQVAQAVEVDTEAPVPECIALFGGYYLLFADDNISTTDEIYLYVHDSETGTVFGEFRNPYIIKYIRSGRAPTQTEHQDRKFIYGNGVPWLSAVDASGNDSSPVACQP
jgi:hypothetical protein